MVKKRSKLSEPPLPRRRYWGADIPLAVIRRYARKVAEQFHPEKIILFGSAARGELGAHSDFDLLVIKRGKFNYWRLTTAIYRHLRGAGVAVDVVVATPEDVERYRHTHCLVICPALQEGKIVYGA